MISTKPGYLMETPPAKGTARLMKPGYLAYLAGFFDADGSIGITPPRDTSLYLLSIHVVQVVPAPLLLFQEAFGGKIGRPRGDPPRRPVRTWTCETKKAEAALRAMLPWLVVKRERAELALEFRELFKGANIVPRGRSCNPEKRGRIMLERQGYYEQMRVLNRRGAA